MTIGTWMRPPLASALALAAIAMLPHHESSRVILISAAAELAPEPLEPNGCGVIAPPIEFPDSRPYPLGMVIAPPALADAGPWPRGMVNPPDPRCGFLASPLGTVLGLLLGPLVPREA